MITGKNTKTAIRERMIELRNGIRPEDVKLKSHHVYEHFVEALEGRLDMMRIAFVYVRWGNEVDTYPIIGHLLSRGIHIAVPKINIKHKRLEAYYITHVEDDLQPGTYGILEPKAYARWCDPEHIDLVITPGVAFSESGHRIGYGGGYYDRFFSVNIEALRVGLAYEFQVHKGIPNESYDQRLDMLVTERRVFELNGRSNGK